MLDTEGASAPLLEISGARATIRLNRPRHHNRLEADDLGVDAGAAPESVFAFFEDPLHFEREKRLEGRYVISTSEKKLTALDAVALYKQLTEVERGFRRMKGVLSLRPVYHQVEPRVRAHIFVAALGLLLQTLLQQRLEQARYPGTWPEALPQGLRTSIASANPLRRPDGRSICVMSPFTTILELKP